MAKDGVSLKYKALLIGGSAGSLEVLLEVLPFVNSPRLPAIIIVLHRKVANDFTLSMLLSTKTSLPVKEVEEKEPILPGKIYLAPADYHLLIEHDETFSLDDSEKVNYSRPSIDITFETAAETYKEKAVALLLSGANADGVDGLKTIKEFGGLVSAQDPETADVSYMPLQAVANVRLDKILTIENMATYINGLNG